MENQRERTPAEIVRQTYAYLRDVRGHDLPALLDAAAALDREQQRAGQTDVCREALNWLVHLHCGVGKAGHGPETGEWEAAIEAGKLALNATSGLPPTETAT